ncbi:MAG: hypothetical protein HYS07_06430 [Chlamydiae bacterium]|nr:hypothetical protein [Chlamydiota bacterium]MBI3276558.1 hypothetical protein [Chlamydiota bacterium]
MTNIKIQILFLLFLITFSQTQGSVEDLISEGDKADEKWDHAKALELYEKALSLDSSKAEILWRISREYSDLGAALTDSKERKEKGYDQKGVDFSRKAVELDPQNPKAHLYLSIALGRWALTQGAKEKVCLSKEIKDEAQRTLELDPNEHVAWHILGCWNREIASLNWIERKFADLFFGGIPKEASLEESVRCLKKAIEIRPDAIIHHLELGITYEKLNQTNLAKEEYEKVLKLPIYDSEDPIHQKEAGERLKRIEKWDLDTGRV